MSASPYCSAVPLPNSPPALYSNLLSSALAEGAVKKRVAERRREPAALGRASTVLVDLVADVVVLRFDA